MTRLIAACLFVSLSFFGLLAKALEVTGRIQWNDICPAYENIRGARAILDNGRWSGYIRRDGVFAITDVEPGTYILSVISHDFVFDPLRIDVSDAEPYASVYAYVPGTPLAPAPLLSIGYPIVVSAKDRNAYFVEHEAFDPLAMLKSPMMMIMIATGVLLFATPYLMSHMDPEALKEVKERQNKILSAQNSLTNMDMGGLANLLGKEAVESSQQSSRPVSQSTTTPGKAKARGRKR